MEQLFDKSWLEVSTEWKQILIKMFPQYSRLK